MHADLDLYKNKVVLYGDVNMLTDRQANNVVSPSELDWIVGLAVHWRDMEFAVYHEQDRPLDRGGSCSNTSRSNCVSRLTFPSRTLGLVIRCVADSMRWV